MKHKHFFGLITAVLLSGFVHAQGNYPSPTAASLGVYGSVPVSLSTGTPQINIPICELTEGDISVPVSLSYHSAGVKVGTRPGWAGLGWSVHAGGQITRRVNGFPDEYKTAYFMWYDINNNGTNDGGDEDLAGAGFYYVSQNFDDDYISSSNLGRLSALYFDPPSASRHIEVTSDEYAFSFLGYSGKFYRDFYGNWVVSSSDRIVVAIKSFAYPTVSPSSGGVNIPDNYEQFHEFVLTTPDGFRYTFGGTNAVEYTIPYRKQNFNRPVATTWKLTSIESPQKYKVDFSYTTGSVDATLTLNHDQVNVKIDSVWDSNQNKFVAVLNCTEDYYSSKQLRSNKADGSVVYPVFLDKIEGSNTQAVKFSSSNATTTHSVGYNLSDYSWTHHSSNPDGIAGLYTEGSFNSRKLNTIQVTFDDVVQKQYDLEYHTYTAGVERLKLKTLTQKSTAGNTLSSHQFHYHAGKLPAYVNGAQNEWGYYDHNTDYRAELLKEIVYPTGGWTEFNFTKPTYHYTLDDATGAAIAANTATLSGGFVIQQIINYSDSVVVGKKSYTYHQGVLLKNWIDHTKNYSAFDQNSTPVKIEVNISRNVMPFSFDGSDIPVAYGKVIVEDQDGIQTNGRSEATFTSFTTDIWGEGHGDQGARFTLHGLTMPGYATFANKSVHRGKETSVASWDNANNKLTETKTRYDGGTLGLSTPSITMERLTSCNGRIVYFAEVTDIYSDSYLPIHVENYQHQAGVTLMDSTNYTRNNSHLVTRQESSGNKPGETYITDYYYPNPGYEPGASWLDEMMNKNMYGTLLKTENKIKKDGNTTLLSTQKNNYSSYPTEGSQTALLLSSQQQSYQSNALELTHTVTKRDPYNGVVLETLDRSGVYTSYLWTFNNQQMIAKIENATYAAVEAAIDLGPLGTGGNKYMFDQDIRDLIDSLRNHATMSKARVTTYTYHHTWGMTSQTDPNGQTTSYEYDEFGRLDTVKDHWGNIVQKYNYHYKSDQQPGL